MLRQAVNIVNVEGILSEMDFSDGSYQKDGRAVEYIRGTVKVLVNQNIGGVPTPMEIPVFYFTNKYTKAGELNPAYTSLTTAREQFVSMAAAGGEPGADAVYIRGELQMNEYYGRDGKLYSYPRIRASFINRVDKNRIAPKAEFTVEAMIANMAFKTDSEGVEVEPKVLDIKGIVPGWGGRVDVVDFVCKDPKKIEGITSLWDTNDTVKLNGRLNFTSKTEVVYEEVAIGDPIEKQRTTTVNELIIERGSAPYEEENAYDLSEIQQGLADRKIRLAKEKERQETKTRKAPAKDVSKGALDLGF